jgi:hypothetical protein
VRDSSVRATPDCLVAVCHPVPSSAADSVLQEAGRYESGDAVPSYGVARDVTERKLAELELRDLSRRLIRAHEEERALSARCSPASCTTT